MRAVGWEGRLGEGDGHECVGNSRQPLRQIEKNSDLQEVLRGKGISC